MEKHIHLFLLLQKFSKIYKNSKNNIMNSQIPITQLQHINICVNIVSCFSSPYICLCVCITKQYPKSYSLAVSTSEYISNTEEVILKNNYYTIIIPYTINEIFLSCKTWSMLKFSQCHPKFFL